MSNLPLSNYRNKILPLRAQAEVINRWLKQRLEEVIPVLMQREGLDMWIIVAREYNEDPVIMSMLPAPAMAARRRTILVFNRKPDGTVERLTLDRYGHLFPDDLDAVAEALDNAAAYWLRTGLAFQPAATAGNMF